jgi:hypothetical protein
VEREEGCVEVEEKRERFWLRQERNKGWRRGKSDVIQGKTE